MLVEVYGKPNCVQCDATDRAMTKKGIRVNEIDITKDPEAMQKILDLGHQQAPVVIAGDQNWSGFRPDKINELAKTLGL